MRCPLLAALVVGSCVLSRSSVAAQQSTAADTVWRFRAGAGIKRLRECDAAELLVGTKDALVAVDATTGAKLWEQLDLPSLGWGLYMPCGAKTGFSYRQDRIVAFDLVSGQPRWDATALPPFQEIRGAAAMENLDLLLLFLRTQSSDRTLAALRLSTGERLWQRHDLFEQPPAFAAHDGVSDIAEFQTFLLSGDTSLIVYVSPDGPINIDLRSGATLWKGEALAGPRVPDVGDYAAMRLFDSTLIIPRDKGLVGVDARDGHVLWQNTALLPRRATRLATVSANVLVRAGADYVNLLDPATGTSRWPRPLTVRTDGFAYEIAGDRYYLVSHDRFLAADLATGDTTGFAKLRFKESESASQMLRRGDQFIIVSRQNLFCVDAQGALLYQGYYRAPGASFFQLLEGFSALSTFGTASISDRYAYFVTNQPDSAGHKGNSLLRVTLDDGSEAGRIWLHEKAPTYWPDSSRDQILMLADDQTLVAIRFPSAGKP